MNGYLISPENEVTINVAIRHLSEKSDRAGSGFLKQDARFGHDLAQRSRKWHGWTFNMLVAAYKLAWRYRPQLAAANIELPDLPAVRAYVAPKTIYNVYSNPQH